MLNIEMKTNLLRNPLVCEFLRLFFLAENLYKMSRLRFEKEVNKKSASYEKVNLHMNAIKPVSEYYKWPLNKEELAFIFGSSVNRNGTTTTLTLKTLRNDIVHACSITSMKNVIDNYEKTYKLFLSKFIQIFE